MPELDRMDHGDLVGVTFETGLSGRESRSPVGQGKAPDPLSGKPLTPTEIEIEGKNCPTRSNTRALRTTPSMAHRPTPFTDKQKNVARKTTGGRRLALEKTHLP